MVLDKRRPWQLKCEWIALWLITFSVFAIIFSNSFHTITYFGALLFILISSNWRERFSIAAQNPIVISFWLFALLIIVGVFYSTSTPHHIIEYLRMRLWLIIIPFFIMVLREDKWRNRMINAFLIAALITLIMSFFKALTHTDPLNWLHIKHHPRKIDFIRDHTSQSYAMNIAAFICAYRALFEKKHPFLYWTVFILMAFELIFLNSARTGFGLFFALLIYLSFVRFRWRGITVAALLVALLAGTAFFLPTAFQARIKSSYEQTVHYQEINQATPTTIRIDMLNIAKIMIQKSPWFGYGTGGIATAMQTVVPLQDRQFAPTEDGVESIYLNMLLDYGIVGFVFFLFFLATQIKISFQLPQPYRYLSHVVLIATLLGGFFSSFFNTFSIYHLYALLVALCFSAYGK